MTNALDLDAKTETYSDVKRLIASVCSQFQKQNGGELDELIAQGNLLFLQAYDKYDPSRGSFSNYCHFYVRKNLMEGLRKVMQRKARCNVSLADCDLIANQTDPTRFIDMYTDLSTDARMVVNLLVKTPPDLLLILREQRYNTMSSMQEALAEMLCDVGWTPDRILHSFNELKSICQS